MKKGMAALLIVSVFTVSGCNQSPFEKLTYNSYNGFYAKISVPQKEIAEETVFPVRLYYGNDVSDDEAYEYYSNGFEYVITLTLLKYHEGETIRVPLFETTLGSEFITDSTNFVEVQTTLFFWKKYVMSSYFEVDVSLSEFGYEAGTLQYLLVLHHEEMEMDYNPCHVYLNFAIDENVVTFSK